MELLVVIGIITILVGILLPAVSSARRQADTLKCASNLRQIGTAFFQYSNDFKGAWPIACWYPADGAANAYHYKSDAPTSKLSRPWYWHMFLQPYFGKTSVRDLASAQDPNYIASNPVLWGCPQWRPWLASKPADVTAFNGQFNPDEIGYGINWSPTYRPDFPTHENPEKPGVIMTDSYGGGGSEISSSWDHRAYYETYKGANRPGRFFKQREYTQSSDRGLVCDTEYFNVKMELNPINGLPQLGQPVHTYGNYGQTNMDFYRHTSRPPRVSSTTPRTFDASTGIPGNNMLYCDGHVETLHTFKDIYLALRRKFPG